jgi:NRAMP (natural resistance-associated macrophage protein)-like metal ion transporter
MLGVIAVCFGIQIAMADPDWGQVIRGFAPTVEIVKNPEMLYLALGILGATVMPHNLYLHSVIVQTRAYGRSVADKREAITLATTDSTIALMFALTINASILISLPPLSTRPVRPTWPSSIRCIRFWRRCSARPSRRRCSPSRCSVAV